MLVGDLVRVVDLLLLYCRYLLITDSWNRSGIEARFDCTSDSVCGCSSRMFVRYISHLVPT